MEPGNKIQTLEEFKSIISKGEGFITITDFANPNRIHSTTCNRLKEDWFFEKMVENKGKTGLYIWYPSKVEHKTLILIQKIVNFVMRKQYYLPTGIFLKKRNFEVLAT